MVPLMDCMFLLLTFFIYVATTMALQRGIPVELAHAASGESLAKETDPIQIYLRTSGELYVEEKTMTELELAVHLRAMVSRPRAPRPVVINAERGVLHERVVEILDLARQSGVRQVVLAVEPREAATP